MKCFVRLSLVAALTILSAGRVSTTRGASYSWNAVFGLSTWSTASNWNPSGPPGAGDYAFIVNGGVAEIADITTATCGTLSLGGQASGSLRLDVGGTLTDSNEYVGATGSGVLSQSGGVSFVSNDLSVGDSLGGSGTYSLSGGSLLNGVSTLFNNTGAFSLGNSGNGTFIQSGGTVNLQGQGMFAGNSLFERGDYTLSGGLLTTAAFAAVSLGNGGSGSFTQSGGANVTPAIYIGGSSDGSYSLSGSGLLTSANETVGRDARGDFTQSGGTNAATTLYLGWNADGTGSYSLGGGSLAAEFEFVGYNGVAAFSQSGGNHTVSGELDVGYYPGSSGTCNLSGGSLAVSGNLNVGNSGSGTFLQTGGSVNVTGNSGLYLGLVAGSSGSYSLGAGLFAAPAEFINYNGGGSFTFAQSGGVNSVTNDLYLGYLNGSSGSYNLSGGSLAVLASEHVGQSGIGIFMQSGGTNAASVNLDIGFSAGASGTYSLVGGSLAAANNERVGDNGYGTFTQSGGSNTTGGLYLGYNSGASGSYTLSAGLLAAGTISVSAPSLLSQGSIFTQSGGSVTTTQLLNSGTFSYSGGTFNGQLVNNGTCLFSSTFYAPGGIMNNSGGTAFTVPAGVIVGTSSGANTLDNEGTVTLAGGSLAGGQSSGNGGPIINDGLITGYGGLTSGVGITNNAQIIQNGGNLTISAGTAGMVNASTISLQSGFQLRLSGGTLANMATIDLNSSTIADSGLLNNPSGNVVGPGTVTAPFQNSGGVLTVPSGSTNITQPFANSGVIELAATNAQLTGGSIANSGIIGGYGTVASTVNNTGTIESNEGTLTLSGSLQNNAGGLIQPDAGSEITVSAGLAANNGLINLVGGTYDNNSHAMTNYGQISGYGELRTSGLTNQSNVTLSGGSSSVNGAVTNASGGTMQIEYNQALFTGAVVNNGFVNATATTATFNGGFTNYGTYFTDPSYNYFSSLTIGPSGLLQGGIDDDFFVTGPLLTNSGHIDLGATSQMVVDNGAGTLTQTGGTLEMGTGAMLSAGTVQINGGVLEADGPAAVITASLVYASSARSTYEGVLAGAGNSLTVDDHLSKLALSGTGNTYGGGTIVTAGELFVTSPGGIESGTRLVVGANASAIFAPVLPGAASGANTVPEPPALALLCAAIALLAWRATRCRRLRSSLARAFVPMSPISATTPTTERTTNMWKLTRLMLGLPLAATCLLAAPASARAMDIVLTFDTSGTASVSNWGAQTNSMTSAIAYVAQEYDSLFTDNITVGITVYGATGTGIYASSYVYYAPSSTSGTYSYTQVLNALKNNATQPAQQIAVANLPMTDPSPDGGPYNVPVAEAAALGLLSQSSSYAAGSITFPADSNWNLNPNNRGAPGGSDFFGFVEHEMSEALGRSWGLGNSYLGNNNYLPNDLFRYDGGTTTRDMTDNTNVWFSINGGKTDLNSYNYAFTSGTNSNTEDPDDWGSYVSPTNYENSLTNDAYNAYSAGGVKNGISSTDLVLMNVLGFHLSAAAMSGGTWVGNASGSWTTASYWTYPIVPTGGTTTVYFAGVPVDPSAPITVTLDGNQSAAALVFNVGNANGYTLAQGSGGTLSLGTNSGSSITVVAGSHAISAPMTLEGDLTVNVASGSALQLSGPIGEASAGTSFMLNGPGTLNYSSVGTWTGKTSVKSGTLNVTGGVLPAANEFISGASTPVVVLSGGADSVSTALYVGNDPGESGTYLLQGGTLSAPTEYVGNNGSGTFTQSSGVNSVSTELDLGYNAAGSGSYSLTAGALTVPGNLNVGNSGSGNFIQSGGTCQASDVLEISVAASSSGSYSLSGSGLLIGGGEYVGFFGNGTFTQSRGTNTANFLYLGEFSGATGSYILSRGSLAAGFEYLGYNGVATFSQSGGNHTVSTELDLGYFAGGSGTYSISGGSLAVSGNLNLGNSGSGTFLQTGGSVSVTGNNDLSLGYLIGASGSYTLGGGLLSAQNSEHVGNSGSGSFTQSAGTNAISSNLDIGFNAAASGTYSLGGGQLTVAGDEHVGESGSGSFSQTGGTNSVTNNLNVGNNSGASGLYTLSGGSLAVLGIEYVGYSGSGSFTQTGGTNTVASDFHIALTAGSSGSYALGGSGSLVVSGSEFVGGSGNGVFMQTGGTNFATNNLYIGHDSGGVGAYTLGGGLLAASSEYVGYTGSGSFTQNGGTNSVSGVMYLAYNSAGTGSYNLGGGLLTAGTISVGANGIFAQMGGTVAPTALLNSGTFSYSGGTFDGQLVNNGTCLFNASFYAAEGIVNNASFTVSAGIAVGTSSGAYTLDNEGTITLSGGTLAGGQSAGSGGAIVNNGLLSGYGALTSGVGITNSGQITVSGGNLTIVAGAAGMTNAGTVAMALGYQLRLSGSTLANTGTIDLNSSTLAGSGLLNNTSGTVAGPGTITAPFANSGSVISSQQGTIDITQAFVNSGGIQLAGLTAVVTGGAITNSGSIDGYGVVSNPVTNTGTIESTGGGLTLSASVQNSSGGTIEAAVGSELTVSLGLAANKGTIDLVGGTYDNNSHPLTNDAQITGYGLLRTGGLANQASFTLTGGTSTVDGAVTNASSGTMEIEHYQALFSGAVVNNGLIKTTSTIVTYAGGFVNDGNYFSDPATNYFSSLAVGPTGLLQGGVGDQFFVTAGSVSNAGRIDLGGTSLMVVDNGAGALAQSGGMLEIGTSAALSAGTVEIAGGTLLADGPDGEITASLVYASPSASTYQGVLAGADTSLTLDNPAALLFLSGTSNSFMGGTYVETGTLVITSAGALPEGSNLIVGYPGTFASASISSSQAIAPVPEPSTLVLLVAGVALMAMCGKRR